MATDFNPPVDFATEKAVFGHAYLFAQQRILFELQEAFDVLQLGVVPLVGEFAGSGTDTLRVTHMGNIGWSVPMDALASETDAITPKKITAGYATISVGMYGLGHAETYKHAILGREPETGLDALKAKVPMSWMRTFRDLVCDAGSGISVAVGSASADLGVDDWLDLVTVYQETDGAGARGAPVVMVDPAQITQSNASARNEPAFQNSVMDFGAVQGLGFGQVLDNYLGLGIRVVKTSSINQSGGAYQGFSFSPGGIGWGRASTAGLRTANPQGTILIPDFGLVIEEKPGTGSNAQRAYEARTIFGVALGNDSDGIHVLRRLISKV